MRRIRPNFWRLTFVRCKRRRDFSRACRIRVLPICPGRWKPPRPKKRARRLIRLGLHVFAAVAVCQPSFAAGLEESWSSYLLERRAGETTTARRYPFDDCFTASSALHGIPKTLLLAIARGESTFDAAAVSETGAVGIMQIHWPHTARHLRVESRKQLFDPCVNIDAGARYMAELLDRFDGNLHASLVAYNMGPTRVAAMMREHAGLLAESTWYSRYIYGHLTAVLHGEERQPGGAVIAPDVVDSSAFASLRVGSPLRVRSMGESLKRAAPRYRFE
ncbi:MAG: lytic transglycosylase domain-containing protein [Candidatus Tectomicrobia bacterium]|nr:lytic transglycosylase domain-containing protein [Candidatus Tectomicrobia bacterium]